MLHGAICGTARSHEVSGLPIRAAVTTLARVTARAPLALAAVLGIALVVYWLTRGAGDTKAPPAGRPEPTMSRGRSPSGASSAPATPDARPPAHPLPARVAAERAAMLEAIATARSHRTAAPAHATAEPAGNPTATTLDIVDNTGDTSEWEKRTLGTLSSLLGQCYDLGRADDPTLQGTVMLRFTLVGEPNVGGLLERADIIDDNTSITQQTIRDCITQQLYALELDPPPDGVRVERELTLRFP
ncbi:MAG TPA: hypothetical protein VGF94_00295 [Kofleriaceae bacterium]|jgi:hypothetical protein